MSSPPPLQLAYPLDWPSGRPRTRKPIPALFRNAGNRLTWTTAQRRLVEQVNLVTQSGHPWRVKEQVLSCNIRFTASGARDRNVSRREPEDPGVAFYFTLDRQPHVLACDRWDTVYDNIAAIAAHIEALRGQERWGVGDIRQAFAGYVALPAPEQWWQVLGLDGPQILALLNARQLISDAYRRLARDAHPDREGGSDAAMARLNAARDAAIAALEARG
jgi:hypothetical protein